MTTATSGTGPIRVMAAGVFDLLHTGHLHYLREARGLGDELIVVVARDSSVRKRKHPPITPEAMRLELVDALKPVDEAILGDEEDHYATVERVEPDIIALGYDDYHKADEVEAECRRRGLEVTVERVSQREHDLAGTRRILKRILDSGRYEEYAASVEEGSP